MKKIINLFLKDSSHGFFIPPMDRLHGGGGRVFGLGFWVQMNSYLIFFLNFFNWIKLTF